MSQLAFLFRDHYEIRFQRVPDGWYCWLIPAPYDGDAGDGVGVGGFGPTPEDALDDAEVALADPALYFDPTYDPDDRKRCAREGCGHVYYRHFDSYANNAPVGCKYCECGTFVPENA